MGSDVTDAAQGTAFVGLNQIQTSFTGFCPAAIVFKALGAKDGAVFS